MRAYLEYFIHLRGVLLLRRETTNRSESEREKKKLLVRIYDDNICKSIL